MYIMLIGSILILWILDFFIWVFLTIIILITLVEYEMIKYV